MYPTTFTFLSHVLVYFCGPCPGSTSALNLLDPNWILECVSPNFRVMVPPQFHSHRNVAPKLSDVAPWACYLWLRVLYRGKTDAGAR